MIELLRQSSLLLLFVVAALGFLIGRVKVGGSSLGVAAVLFTGLAFGALDPQLQIPQIVFSLGLSIFVYTIGLSSGPSFFDSYRRNGPKEFLFLAAILTLSGFVSVGLWYFFGDKLGLDAASIAGIYAGSTTSTPALASLVEYLKNLGDAESAQQLENMVVGYTWSYPMGVFGAIIAIVILDRFWKVNYPAEAKKLRDKYPVEEGLEAFSILVNKPEAIGSKLRDLCRKNQWNVVFGRIYRDGQVDLVDWSLTFREGDIVVAVGAEDELERVREFLGERSDSSLAHDHSAFNARRIFVSNPKIAGRSLASLQISERYNAVITRIRRGDIDMLAKGDTILELGDRIRFIAQREDLAELSSLFGDSYQASSRVDLFSFGAGISIGLLIGMIPIPLGAVDFKLGFAGGPLLVGLILGSLRRTGPIIWTLPYSANQTLQQMGLILLLASIGVSSGSAFAASVSAQSLNLILASAIISLTTAFGTLILGYKLLKEPFGLLSGMAANQPAILDFALNRAGNRLPLYGYAMVFPIALISKILIAQIIFLVLNSLS
jgi:putative transport protein